MCLLWPLLVVVGLFADRPGLSVAGALAGGGASARFLTDSNELTQLGLSLYFMSQRRSAIAFVLGCALAALAHYIRPLRLLIEGRLTPFLNAFSGIGWLFLAILWFGLNDSPSSSR